MALATFTKHGDRLEINPHTPNLGYVTSKLCMDTLTSSAKLKYRAEDST